MKKPLVSISCITYNHEDYIRQCLDGFLMQVCDFDYEILIHDDASTDGTKKIIEDYQSRYPEIIKPVFQNQNQYSQGVRSINARFNFPRAEGKYIALCDGDDFWTDPLKLKKQVEYMECNSDTVLCCHETKRVDQYGNSLIDLEGIKTDLIKYSSVEMLHTSFPPLSMLFRNVYLNYSENLMLAPHGDVVLITLLSQHGSLVKLNFVGGCYRVHEGGTYSNKSVINKAILSIRTRRILISSKTLTTRQKNEIRKNIYKRKIKAIKYCLFKVDILGIISVIFT